MDPIKIEKLQYLNIGVEGTNDAMSIVIDVNSWIEELAERGYYNPCFHLLFQPYNQNVPITQNTEYDSETGMLTWNVDLSATRYAGMGYTEIRALNHPDTGLVQKTKAIPTLVDESLTGVDGGVIPAPYDDWVNSILALIDKLNNALNEPSMMYAISDDYSEAPEDGWQDEMPDVTQHKGDYLWTRTTFTWSTGAETNMYTSSYIGVDGSGAVDSVNGYTGAVKLDGRNLYVNIDATVSNRVTLNDVISSKLNANMIVYDDSSEGPSNPVEGMIWLKPKT